MNQNFQKLKQELELDESYFGGTNQQTILISRVCTKNRTSEMEVFGRLTRERTAKYHDAKLENFENYLKEIEFRYYYSKIGIFEENSANSPRSVFALKAEISNFLTYWFYGNFKLEIKSSPQTPKYYLPVYTATIVGEFTLRDQNELVDILPNKLLLQSVFLHLGLAQPKPLFLTTLKIL